METLLALDKKLLLYLNEVHNPIFDQVMFYATKTFIWSPLYLYLVILIFRKHKRDGWFFLIGAGLTILLSDQITTSIMKPYFLRLRPSHEPALQGLVHLVNGYAGGLYGFASSHAANTFGTAMFVCLVLKQAYKEIIWIFVWAAFVTYTRIYLGVHYPGDVLVGALIGIFCGWLGFQFSKLLIARAHKKTATSK